MCSGKPKGVAHTTAGYLLHANLTTKWSFDIQVDAMQRGWERREEGAEACFPTVMLWLYYDIALLY